MKGIDQYTILYETDNYFVALTKFTDPVLADEVDGYGVFSKETNVREAETRRSYTAKVLCRRYEQDDSTADADALLAAKAPTEMLM